MIVKYVVQMYSVLTKKYITMHTGDDLERAKIQACKPYNTRQGTATTRILRITEEVVHKFTRRNKK